MSAYLIRLIVCSIIGIALIGQGFNMMHAVSPITQTFGLATVGFGFLMIIYSFSPRTAKTIIKAIVDIVSIPLKALFS